jgi:hypothetical protein
MILGPPGTGKSTLICDIAYNKQDIIPVCNIYSETEGETGDYKKHFPDSFIYPGLDIDAVKDSVKRQKIARKHLNNPWCLTIFDDVTSDPKTLKLPVFQGIMKNGRHYKGLYLFGLQYGMDMTKSMRGCIDGTFILAEPNAKIREVIYENYAGIVPTFELFCDMMDEMTKNKNAIFIHNRMNCDEWHERVFWYKANPVPENWKFGCADVWNYHNERIDPDYEPEY